MFVSAVKHKVITLILVGVAFVLPFLYMGNNSNVYAAGNPSFACTSSEYTALSNIINSANSGINPQLQGQVGVKLLILVGGTGSNCRVEFDKETYSDLGADDKKLAMQIILEGISESGLPSNLKLRLYNFIEEQDKSTASLVRHLSEDVDADFATAYSWFRPFSGGISTVLGLITLLLFLFLALTMVVDLAYIVLPLFRNTLDSADGSKPKFVSTEAYKAMQEADKSTDYKSPLTVYFKRKVGQIIVLSICILYLVGGKIYDLVAWIIDAFSGVVG